MMLSSSPRAHALKSSDEKVPAAGTARRIARHVASKCARPSCEFVSDSLISSSNESPDLGEMFETVADLRRQVQCAIDRADRILESLRLLQGQAGPAL